MLARLEQSAALLSATDLKRAKHALIVLPSDFVLVVNLKTAKALGLTIPQSVMLRATEVVE